MNLSLEQLEQPEMASYSMTSFYWRHLPHKHYWRHTTKGYDLDTHERIEGWQCYRCKRPHPREYRTMEWGKG